MRYRSCTALSRNSAPRRRARPCLLARASSTCGRTASLSPRCLPSTSRRIWKRARRTPFLLPLQPIKVSAPEYVDLLMTWVEGQINNERLFPTSTATPFPRDFKSVVSNIFKRLFRGPRGRGPANDVGPCSSTPCPPACLPLQCMRTSTTRTLRRSSLSAPRGTSTRASSTVSRQCLRVRRPSYLLRCPRHLQSSTS